MPRPRVKKSGAQAAAPLVPPAMAAVARIRSNRVRPARDLSLQRDMDVALADIKRLRRNVSSIAAAWEATVPPDLAKRTTLSTLSRGQLAVLVPDAATRFALDRFLRAGGFAALAGACTVNLGKVRITVRDH